MLPVLDVDGLRDDVMLVETVLEWDMLREVDEVGRLERLAMFVPRVLEAPPLGVAEILSEALKDAHVETLLVTELVRVGSVDRV